MLSICLAILDTDEDRSSFEDLYYKYRQGMYSVAYSVLRNKEDSEDAVQKSLLSIANNYEKIKKIPSQELKAFIVTIVRNHSINIYNSNKRHAKMTVVYADSDVPTEVDFFENLEFEELIEVISNLPAIYKDIIFLYYLQGLTTKEISKLFDIKLDAVWKRLERARKLLKDELDKRGV